MKSKKILSNPYNRKALLAILSCIVSAFFLFACGGSGSSSGSYSSETGAVAFSVEWPDRSNESSSVIPQSYGSPNALKPAALDCGSSGIVNITAELYEASGDHIIDAGPWECSAHSATMDNIPVGTNRTLHVYGKDGDGNVLYMGVTTGIDVVAGETADAGTVVLGTALYLSIDYAYFQYRLYSDGVTDDYRGWVELTKFGVPGNIDDILTASEMISITRWEATKDELLRSKIKLKNSAGTEIPITFARPYRMPSFWGNWNTSTSSIDFSPYLAFGIWLQFDLPSVGEGEYTYEVTTSKGDAINKTLNFPGDTTLPIVQVATMNYEWLGGSLHLWWGHPGGSFDQFRVTLIDQNYNDLLYVKLPSNVTDITIPAQVVQEITDTLGPYVVRWQVQTRNYGSDNNNYARGYSDRIDFDWLEQPTPPAGKYDLLAYFPLSAGSMWSYDAYDATPPSGNFWQADDEYVEYSGTFKSLSNIRRYTQDPTGFVDYAGYFNFDGQYIYFHGESEYNELDPDYGSSYFSPSITLDRFLGVGESTTSSVTRVEPDGSETATTFTLELLEHVTTCSAGEAIFDDCLRIRQTSVEGGETEITEVYWALGVGEVEIIEIQDPGDLYPDTKELTSYTVQPY